MVKKLFDFFEKIGPKTPWGGPRVRIKEPWLEFFIITYYLLSQNRIEDYFTKRHTQPQETSKKGEGIPNISKSNTVNIIKISLDVEKT